MPQNRILLIMLNIKAKYKSLNLQLLYVLLLVGVFLSKQDYNFSGFTGQLPVAKKVEITNAKLKSLVSKSVVFAKDDTLIDTDESEIEVEALAQDYFHFNFSNTAIETSRVAVSNFKHRNFIGLKQPYYILFCNLKIDVA